MSAPPNVPSARGYILTAFRTAAAEVFGEAGTAALSPIAAPTPPPKWIAEADLIAGAHAIWEGPARRERARYNAFIQRQVELGSGRVQRMLLSLASPRRVIDRAPAIWSSEHTHGALTVVHLGERSAVLRLGEHPYVETPQARATIAEVFRHIVGLTRAGEVSETHALERLPRSGGLERLPRSGGARAAAPLGGARARGGPRRAAFVALNLISILSAQKAGPT